eukprot:6953836-Pyramimonas_sp.AAC.1
MSPQPRGGSSRVRLARGTEPPTRASGGSSGIRPRFACPSPRAGPTRCVSLCVRLVLRFALPAFLYLPHKDNTKKKQN